MTYNANKFQSLPKELKERLIDYLIEGNSIEELAEQLLEALPQSEIDEMIKEVKEQDQ
jgi:hypothetical protein